MFGQLGRVVFYWGNSGVGTSIVKAGAAVGVVIAAAFGAGWAVRGKGRGKRK